jgi:ABC-type sugar transport system ATPase subunit
MTAGLRLTVDSVSHRYGETTALHDISVVVEPGEVTVLIGPSGCGKSTLLGIMGGMLAPSFGRVLCQGETPPTASIR